MMIALLRAAFSSSRIASKEPFARALEIPGPAISAARDRFGTIMLDNFTPDELREGVALVAGRAIVEASGGVNLDTVRAIAETGVDVVSVGALTHSVRALDLGLDVTIA